MLIFIFLSEWSVRSWSHAVRNAVSNYSFSPSHSCCYEIVSKKPSSCSLNLSETVKRGRQM